MPEGEPGLGGQGRCQHLEQGVAILDGPVALVEPAALGQKVPELRSLKPKPAPGDLGMGAGPGLDLEAPGQALTEGPVEAGIVRDDQIGRLDEPLDRLKIEHLAGNHLGRDAGQTGDLRADGHARLAQGIERANHVTDPAFLIVHEGDHAEFDDLVPRVIQARGFGVQDDGDLLTFTRRTRNDDGPGPQAAENTIVAGGLQHPGSSLMIRSFE